ncbi:MAG: Ig-like domain-containing protein [Lachnospiraceae bacterium]|nr:Ig-like domain-containing protein [Lachnospiraceae bacterium]
MRKDLIIRKTAAVLIAVTLVLSKNTFVFAAEDTISEDAVNEETAVNESGTEEIITKKPAAEEPVTGESDTEEPAAEEPAEDEQAVEEPASGEPVAEEPVSEQSSDEVPATKESADAESVSEEMASVTESSVDEKATEDFKEERSSARIKSGGESIPVGAKISLKDEFGIDSDYKNVKYTVTEGKNCAEINGSTLVAKKAGEVSVKVTYKYDGEKGEDETGFTIYSVGFKKKTVIWNDKSEYDATTNLKTDTVEGTPVWSSSAPTVATIDPNTGKVTVLAGGNTVISATYSYGEKERVCKFKFVVKLPGLKVSSKLIKFGGVFSTKLVNIEKDTPVSWYLDANETRATFVDQEKGKIRVIGVAPEGSPVLLHAKVGTEELTASITTTEPYLGGLPKSYEEEGTAIIKRKKSRQFSVKGIAKGTTVEWSSSDDETVSVSSKGLVKAKQYGSATITAAVEGYGNLTVEVDVPEPETE